MAIADTRPHSSSFWTTLHYAILEIGSDSIPFRQLKSGDQTLYEGNDDLSGSPSDTFAVENGGHMSRPF